MELWGKPTRLVIEVDTRRATIRIPLTQFEVIGEHGHYGELRIPLGREWLRDLRDLRDAEDETEFRGF